MSTLSLRLPESLHKSARELAEKENISINQLITMHWLRNFLHWAQKIIWKSAQNVQVRQSF